MTTFQPFAPGLGQAFPIGTATDEPAVTHAEDPDMPKQHPIAKRLLAAIENAGGSLAAAQLAEKLPDVADANRSYHARKLVKEGALTATGSTQSRTYHLAKVGSAPTPGDERKSTAPKPPKLAPARTDRSEPPTSQATKPTQTGIAPHHLKRLLTMALRVPGPIADDDREALAAVAAGC